MSRDEFLILCRTCAVKLGRHFRFYDVKWEPAELVTYDGKQYYPLRLLIGFDRNGEPKYSAELHDTQANSVVVCELCRVEKGEL